MMEDQHGLPFLELPRPRLHPAPRGSMEKSVKATGFCKASGFLILEVVKFDQASFHLEARDEQCTWCLLQLDIRDHVTSYHPHIIVCTITSRPRAQSDTDSLLLGH
jgi:hypothetical protein